MAGLGIRYRIQLVPMYSVTKSECITEVLSTCTGKQERQRYCYKCETVPLTHHGYYAANSPVAERDLSS
jgi:hypothetical protein